MDRKNSWKDRVRVIGPVKDINDILYLKWSASGLEFETDAGRVEAEIISEWTSPAEIPRLGIFIDDEERPYKKIAARREKERYILYENEENRKVKIRLVKLTEEQYGRIGLVNLAVQGELRPTEEPDREILFIGDSITAGYGADGIDGLRGIPTG